ncbi:MAG: hypothetical protein ABMA64_00110 [Myxococcota bacterium]
MVGLWFVAAQAAEVTELAPDLGLRLGLAYAGSSLTGGLVEGGTLVGRRRVARHDLDLALEVAPTNGFAVTLGLETTPSYVFTFPESRAMVVEPLTGSGSYLTGAPVDAAPSVRAGGVEGVWIGVAGAPFAERDAPHHQATSRLELAFRTPSKGRNLWTANDEGKRGPSSGGSAFKLGAAFSTERGAGEPWLRAEWLHESKVVVDVIDESGQVWARELPLDPASTFLTEAGIELLAARTGGEPEDGPESKTTVNLWLGAGYRTWGDVASGVYLPNVLDGSRAIPVTTGDTVLGRVGVGVGSELEQLLAVRAALTFDYAVPYVLEHVYPVTTSADTFQVGWSLTVTGKGSFAPEG